MSTPKKIENIYPLSPMQQGLLFHSLYEPTSGVYVDQLSYRLEGALDTEAFKRAWQQVVARHPILRTSLYWTEQGQPVQIVHQHITLPWKQQDWRGMTQDEQETRLASYLQAELARGFDVTHAPLLGFSLLQLADQVYQWVLMHHHLLLDGWSLSLVLKEVFAYYEAERCGKTLLLAQPRPYRDYIAWLEQQDLAQAERFWREELRGIPAPTPLGMDHGESHLQTPISGYASEMILLSEATTGALQRLVGQHHLTLSTLVQGAWALLLGCYSAQEEVLFGLTVSGRPAELPGVEQMVGLFINTLPLRVRMDPQVGVMQWLRGVQDRVLEVQNYAYAPLVQIQGWSQVPRGTPLFESIVVFENYPVDTTTPMGFAGVQAQQMRVLDTTNYPLTVMAAAGRRMRLEIGYRGEQFASETIRGIVEHLRTLLEAMVVHPEQRIGELPLLTQKDARLLEQWNATQSPFPEQQSVSQLFEEQVARIPDAVALVCGEQQVTYEELNRRANQLAHYLLKMGVGPEVCVGVCMARSLDLLISLLAILKAGGAYVPLDPDAPQERLLFILEDAQVSVLLSQEHLQTRLPRGATQLFYLDSDWPHVEQEFITNPDSSVTAEHLAYVIYTSGSTGTPKGVSAIHRGVVRLVKNTNYAELTPNEVFLQFAPISFDASTLEIWGSLLNGARLVIFPPGLPSLEELGYSLQYYQITTLWLTSGLFQQMLEEQPESLRRLRQLLAGGDVLSIPHVHKAVQMLGEGRLINGYGPTEGTTFTCCYPILDLKQIGLSIPIGRPIANTQVYVLDAQLRPVPVGALGELYIGGVGLARGYLRRAELTAEYFVPDPFSRKFGARLYRSGDRVRWLADGTLEFMGRLDSQVKVRGFRIELGEIEAVLGRHPEVQVVAVVAREEVVGEKRLVAYLVPHPGQPAPTIVALRTYIQQQLPEYMIPAAFVMLEALPLTPNGKVDRRALPAPEGQRPELESGYAAPTTPIQELLVGIWQQVLRLEQVGIHDNFFALGGHSLLATRVMARLRRVFGVELSLRALFEAPTIATLALEVETAFLTPTQVQEGAGPLLPVSREQRLPLSFAQQRLWFLDQWEPESPLYNVAAALRLRGPLGVRAFCESIDRIIQRHEVLRTSFPSQQGQPWQEIAARCEARLPLIDLSGLSVQDGEQVALELAEQEGQRPFDLGRGPVLRVVLVRLGVQEHVLLLTVHHIVADGWSIEILLGELRTWYTAAVTGKPAELPELVIQYADYAFWQRDWLRGEVLEQQVDYWRRQLAGVAELMALPTDHPRPATLSHRGQAQRFMVSWEVQEGLRQVSQREGVTLFMTLLAAFECLLSWYSGQDDIVVGSPIANRMRPEVEPLIGFFVNTLVLRSDLSGNPTFREVLRRVRKVCLEAYSHQDVPFEQLVEALHPQRNASHLPLFQIWFVLQEAPFPDVDLPGLAMLPLERKIAITTARYDLRLDLLCQKDGLHGLLEYQTDLFEPATIARMSRHLTSFLQLIVKSPDFKLSLLTQMLTDTENQLRDARKEAVRETSLYKLRNLRRDTTSVKDASER